MGRGKRLLARFVGRLAGGATRNRGRTIALAAIISAGIVTAATQYSEPSSDRAESELPSTVQAALAQTVDFAFNYDQPGFYAVVEAVRNSSRSPGYAQEPIVVNDWQDLLHRPSEFRGRPVTLEGCVGRNKDPYHLPAHPELGQLWQLELWRPEQPISCTAILTGSAADVPVGAWIRITGYFVMVHQFYGRSNRVQQAALVVAPGPTLITRPLPPAPTAGFDWRWMLGAILAGIVLVIAILGWSARTRPHDLHRLHAKRPAPVNLADDLQKWAAGSDPDTSPEQTDDH